MSIKYWGDTRNQKDVCGIIGILEELGLAVYCVVKHAERWGHVQFTPQELMQLTFREIEASDLLIANVADWPIGVGIEVGYAYARKIPILCICPEGSRMANTVEGLADAVVVYSDLTDLKTRIAGVHLIRASAPNRRHNH